MIIGAHFLFYSRDPEADRRFLRDVLGFPSIDAGGGWSIFALPPAEVAVHPAACNLEMVDAGHTMAGAVLYLMCDDIRATVRELEAKSVACSALETLRWGIRTLIRLPSGGAIGIYQPSHETAIRRE